MHKRTLARDNLAKRQKVKDDTCLFCAEKESCHHMFFECVVATRIWSIISRLLNIEVGNDIYSIGKLWLSDKRNSLVNIITYTIVYLETQE